MLFSCAFVKGVSTLLLSENNNEERHCPSLSDVDKKEPKESRTDEGEYDENNESSKNYHEDHIAA
eukprot:11897300-Ditylum_brightwellii.AAC.1